MSTSRCVPVVLATAVLLGLGVAVASAADGGDLIRPEAVVEVESIASHSRDDGPVLKAIVDARPSHSHFIAPEVMERWKDAALWNADAPAATALEGAILKDALTSRAPTAAVAFDGLDRRTSGYEGFIFLPPDTVVAASPGRVLEATNVAARLSKRGGGGAVIRSLYSLFGHDMPASVFDPKVFYDRLTNRFFLVALFVDDRAERSFIELAVSRSANPATLDVPGDWCAYRFQGRVGSSWADYPGLGMNENYIAITSNNFNFTGGFRSVYAYVIDKQSLVANANSCPKQKVKRYKLGQDAFGEIAFTVQPALHYSTNDAPGTPLYMVSSQPVAAGRNYTLWTLFDEPGTAFPLVARTRLPAGANYAIPPEAPQKGGVDMDSGDMRMQSVVYRDGTVWAVQGNSCNFGSLPAESCVRVLGIEPDADFEGTIVYDENIGGGEGWYYWMPGVAVNGDGHVMLAYQRSHADVSIGMGFAGKPADSNDFTAGNLVNGRCGLDNVDGNDTNRTGDYVGIQADPADNTSFWIAGEYSAGVKGLGCDWRTRVALIRP